jgi:hypothetical protein
MQIVIDIPEKQYCRIMQSHRRGVERFVSKEAMMYAIKTGTPLPKEHGRLIDADALEKKMCDREEELGDDRAMWESSAVSVALDMFAPTVIEADKENS